MVLAAGVLAGQQDEPAKDKSPAPAKKATPPAIRFNQTPTAISGASGDTISVAVSADGKRIASVGGSANPASGFVSVIDTASKKELLALTTPRPFNSVGISPDGKLIAFTGQSGELKLLEVANGKTLFVKKLDGAAKLAFAPDGQSLATATEAKT